VVRGVQDQAEESAVLTEGGGHINESLLTDRETDGRWKVGYGGITRVCSMERARQGQ
jgi:hypothetical protein